MLSQGSRKIPKQQPRALRSEAFFRCLPHDFNIHFTLEYAPHIQHKI